MSYVRHDKRKGPSRGGPRAAIERKKPHGSAKGGTAAPADGRRPWRDWSAGANKPGKRIPGSTRSAPRGKPSPAGSPGAANAAERGKPFRGGPQGDERGKPFRAGPPGAGERGKPFRAGPPGRDKQPANRGADARAPGRDTRARGADARDARAPGRDARAPGRDARNAPQTAGQRDVNTSRTGGPARASEPTRTGGPQGGAASPEPAARKHRHPYRPGTQQQTFFQDRQKKKKPRPRVVDVDEPAKPHRSGTVAIVGRPNVGKSTLLNAALGEALAIVSNVPQTTRDRILGIVHRENAEIILLDTPGIHKPYSRLGRALNRTARLAASEADVVVFVTSAPTGESLHVHASDLTLLADIGKDVPTILVVNQVDRVPDKSRLLPFLEEIAKIREFVTIVPLSALKGDGVSILLDEIEKTLPEGPNRFENDEITDRPTRFFVGEFVREPILMSTHEEVPHAVAVEIERFEDQGKTVHIDATIHVERDGQKAILIGRGGEKLKAVGTAARKRIEALVEKKVFLKLWIRVTPDWTESEQRLVELGYGKST